MSCSNQDDSSTKLEFVPSAPSCRKPLKQMEDYRDKYARTVDQGEDVDWLDSEISDDEADEETTKDVNYVEQSRENFQEELKETNRRQNLSNTSTKQVFVPGINTCQTKKQSKCQSAKADISKPANLSSDAVQRTNHTIPMPAWLIFGFLMIGLAVTTQWSNITMSPENCTNSSQALEERFRIFENDLRNIMEKFPLQSRRSWLDIEAGVFDILNSSSKPWTFVLFSNETKDISCLAELLGMAGGKALSSNTSLILGPKDMGDEYGNTIDRLRPLIFEKRAVVVHDLLNIDPGAIQAFHTMCDRENPLVESAIYILTIIVPSYKESTSKNHEVFVENVLTDRFVNKVPIDKLQPLITRLTDGPIIQVVPGNNPTGCSL